MNATLSELLFHYCYYITPPPSSSSSSSSEADKGKYDRGIGAQSTSNPFEVKLRISPAFWGVFKHIYYYCCCCYYYWHLLALIGTVCGAQELEDATCFVAGFKQYDQCGNFVSGHYLFIYLNLYVFLITDCDYTCVFIPPHRKPSTCNIACTYARSLITSRGRGPGIATPLATMPGKR